MTQKSWTFIFLFDFTFLQWHKKVELSFSSLISPFYNDIKKLNFHFPLWFHLFTMTQKSWPFIFLFDFTFLQWHKKVEPFIFLFDFTFLQWHKKVELSFSSLISPFYNDTKKLTFHFPFFGFHLFTMTQKSWPFIFLFDFTFIQWHKKVDLSFSSLISPFYNDTKKLAFHFPLWIHLYTMTQKSWPFIFLFDFTFLQWHKKVELSFSSLNSPLYNDTKKLTFHFPLWFHLFTMTQKSWTFIFLFDFTFLQWHKKVEPFIFLFDFTFLQWHKKVDLSFSSLISPFYNDTKKLAFHFPLWFHLFTMTQKSWPFIFLFDFTFLQWHKKVGLSFSSLISPLYNDTKKLTFHFPLWFHLFTMTQKVELSFSSLISPFYNDTKKLTFIFLFDFTFLQWHKKVDLSFSSLISPFYNDTKSWTFIFLFDFTFLQWHKKVELSFSSLISPFTMTQKSWTFIFLFDFTFLQWHKKVELSFSSLISPFYNDTKKLNFHFHLYTLWIHLYTVTQKSWTFIFLFEFTFLQWHKKVELSFSSLISPFCNDTKKLVFHFPLWFHLFTMTQKSWPFIFLFDFTFLQRHKKVGLSFSSLISPFYNDTKNLTFPFPLWFHLFTMTQQTWTFILLFYFTFLQWHKKVDLSFSSLISPSYNDTKKLNFHFPLWFHLFTMTQKSWTFIFLLDFTFLQWHKKVGLSVSSLISPFYNDTKKLAFHFPLWFHLFTMTQKSWPFIFFFDFTFLQWHKKVGLSFSSLISPFYNDTKKLAFHFPLWFHLYTMTQKSWSFIFLFDFAFIQWQKKVDLSFSSLISPLYNDTKNWTFIFLFDFTFLQWQKKLAFHFPLWFHLFTMTQKSWTFIFLFEFTFLQWHKKVELSFSSLISPFYNDTKKLNFHFPLWFHLFTMTQKSWPSIFLFDFAFLQRHKKVGLSVSSLISPFYNDTKKLAFHFPLWFHLFTMTQKVDLSFSSLISPFYNDTKKLDFHFPLWFHLFTMTQKSWPFIFLFDFTFLQCHKKVELSFSSLILPSYNDTKKLNFHFPLWFHLYTMTQKRWTFILLFEFTFIQWHKKVELSFSSLSLPFYNDTKKLNFHFPLSFHLFAMTQKSWSFIFLFEFTFLQWHKKVDLSFSSLISPLYNDTKKLAFHFPLWFHLFTMTQKIWIFLFLFDFTFLQWHNKLELSFSSFISPFYNDTKKLTFHFPLWFHLLTMTQKSWTFIFLFDFTFLQWHKKVELSFSSWISPFYNDTKKLAFQFPLWFHLFTMTQKSWPFIFLFDFTFLQWHKKVDLSFSSLISLFYNDTKKLAFHFPLWFHLFTMTQKSWPFIFLFDFTFIQWHKKVDLSFSSLISPLYNDKKKLTFHFPLWFHLYTMTQKIELSFSSLISPFYNDTKKLAFHFPLWFHLFTMTQKSWTFIFLFDFTFLQWHKKVELSFSSLISPFYNDTKKLNFHFPLWYHLFTMTQKSWPFIVLFDFTFLQRHKKLTFHFPLWFHLFTMTQKKLTFHFPLWFHSFTMTQKSWTFIFLFDFTFLQWHKKVELLFSSLISPFYNDTKKLNFHFPLISSFFNDTKKLAFLFRLWFHLFTMTQKSWPFIFLFDFTFLQWHKKVGLSFSSLILPFYNDTKSWPFIFLFDFTFIQWHKKVDLSFSSLISPLYKDTKKLTFHFPLWFRSLYKDTKKLAFHFPLWFQLYTMTQKSWTFIFLYDFTFLQWHKKVELSFSSLISLSYNDTKKLNFHFSIRFHLYTMTQKSWPFIFLFDFTFLQWHKKVDLSFSSLISPLYNDTKKLTFHFPLWFHLFTMTKKIELSFSSLISPFYNDTKKLTFHFPLWIHLYTMTQKSWTFIFLFDFTFLQWHKKVELSFSSLISPFYNDTKKLNFHFPRWFHLFTMTQKSWPFIFLFEFTFIQWHKKVEVSFSSLISPSYNDTKKLAFHFPRWFHLFTMTQKRWPFIFLFDFTFLQCHNKVELSFFSLISPFYNDTKKLAFHFPLWFHLFTMTQKSWPFIFLFDFTFIQWHKKVELSFSSLISPIYSDTKKLNFHFPLWFHLFTMTQKSWTFIFLFDFTFLQWQKKLAFHCPLWFHLFTKTQKVDLSFSSLISPFYNDTKKVDLSFSSLISLFYNDTKKLNFHFPLWFHLFTMAQKSWTFIFLFDFTFLQWHKKVELSFSFDFIFFQWHKKVGLSFSSLISPFYNDTKKLTFHFPLWFHLFTMTQKSWPFIFLFDFTFLQWHKKLAFHFPLWFHLYTMTQKSWPFIFLFDFTFIQRHKKVDLSFSSLISLFIQGHKKVGLSFSSLISALYNDTKKLNFHFPLISSFYNDTKKLAFLFRLWFHLFTMTQKSWPFIFLFDFTFIQRHKKVDLSFSSLISLFIQGHKKVGLSFSSLISALYNDTKKLNFHFPLWFHLFTMTQKSWAFIFLFDFTFLQWHKKVELSFFSSISPLYNDTKKLTFHFPLWFHLYTMIQKSWPFIFLFDFTFLQWHKKVDLSFSSLISPFYNETKSWPFIFLFDFSFIQWHKKVELSFSSMISPFYNDTKKLNFHFPLWFHLFTMTQKSWTFIFLFDFTFFTMTQKVELSFSSLISPFYNDTKKLNFHFPLWFQFLTMTQKSWPFIFLFDFTFIQWHKKLNFHFPLWFHLYTMIQKSWPFIFLFDFTFLQWNKKVGLSISSLISHFYNDTKKLTFHFPLWFKPFKMTKKLTFHFPLWFHLFTKTQKVGLSFSSLTSPLYNDTKKLAFHFPLWFHLFTITQKIWPFIFLFDFTFLQWHKKVELSFSSLISPFYNDTEKVTFHFPLWFHLFTMTHKSWPFIFLFDFTFLQWHKKVGLSFSSLISPF